MNWGRWSLLFIIVLRIQTSVSAQCPVTNFAIPSSSCLNQTLQLTNASAPGTYEWDFCAGDLNGTPTAQLLFSLAGVNGRPGIELVWDGTKWFGFVTGTFTNLLYRLEFANGTNALPTFVENLGSLGGKLNQPGAIRIIQEGNQWYGLLLNTATGELLKLSFGSQLSNPIVTTSLLSNIGSTNSGISIGKDATNSWVSVMSTAANQITMVRLGSSLAVPNPAVDIITSAVVPNANNLGDVDVVNICGNWVGFADNLGNGVLYRLDFGANLFSIPVVTQIPSISAGNPGRLRVVHEAGRYYLFVIALDGTLTKLDFGSDPYSIPTIISEGNLGNTLSGSMYGLAIVKQNSVWTLLGVNQANGQVYWINYPDNCSAVPKTSLLSNPIMKYTLSGNYSVSLDNTTSTGIGLATKSITVSGVQAPDIDFNSQNNCAQNNVSFTAINTSGNIISFAWDFDDSQASNQGNPTHIYSIAGTYSPKLTVTASGGCVNSISKPVSMFNPPVADFTLPPIATVCTNQSYDFANTSTFDPGSAPSWEWTLNGSLTSTQQSLTLLFNSPTPQEIRLKAKIPGCENEMIKNISTVVAGPLIDFSVSDNCMGASVPFTNNTVGTVTGYQWSFGDGATSTQTNPGHSYSSTGLFQATLTGTNAAGCQNFTTKSVNIFSLPQPDFAIGLPPFSCSNSPTSFQNNTPPLTDSNITSWSWQFGDPAAGTSNLAAPLYTYASAGNYSAVLLATTNMGCTKSITKPITIAPSPVADFAVGASCLNLATQFTDLSSGGVQTRLWQIGPASFTTTNPSYTFSSSGNFLATLSVTGSNSCSTVKTKTVIVPVPPTLNFTASNLCEGKNSNFTDVTSSSADPVVGWNWNFAGNSLTGNPVQTVFNPQGTYNVKMTTTHTSGCKYTLSRNVVINPSPVAGFTASPDRGAAPLIVQFTNSSQQATTYAWKFYDKVTSTSSQFSPLHTFTSLGNYSAELTASNAQGCTDVLTMPIQVLIPSIDLVLKDFVLVNDPATGKLKSNVTIMNASNIPVTAAEVALFLSDKAVVNETVNLNLNPGQSVSRTLSFTLSPNQFDFSFLCAEIISDKDIQPDNNKRCIDLASTDYFFGPYPNPTTGMLHADWVSQTASQARLIVYNNLGQKSYEWETASHTGLNQAILDLTFLTSGLYYLTVETTGTRKTMRFVRQ